MSDAAALRAEIKAWEKEFKAQNGRAATVEDIKQRPHIQEKYKLYKRFSKQKQTLNQPSTPPRATTLLTSRPHVAQETEPLQSFNPFSPTKHKRRVDVTPTTPRRNLFATPKKTKPKARSTSPEDPFQDDDLVQQPTSAVSRARKRLRGEPVPPSPTKEKRRRLDAKSPPRTRQTSPSLAPALFVPTPAQVCIEDSPVKPPKGGRSFLGLFDEEPIIHSVSRLELSALNTKSKNSPSQAALQPFVQSQEQPKLLKKKDALNNKSLLKGIQIPKKSNLFDTLNDHEAGSGPASKGLGAHEMDLDTKLVENQSKSLEEERYPEHPNALPISHPQLLPPSPPPSESTQSGSQKLGKAKAMGMKGKGRQFDRRRSSDGEDEDESSTEEPIIRYVEAPLHVRGELEEDDPALQVIPPRSPRTDNVEDDAHFDISAVPASLLSVLAISPSTKTGEKEKLYRGLVYGRREGHYDPNCGGEIWGAGENSEPDNEDILPIQSEGEVHREHGGDNQPAWQKAVDIEDDEWEGEPVPWEVGEL